MGDNHLLAAAHAEITSPFRLRLLIETILRNENWFNKVLEESYYHENGFHKIVLLEGTLFKFRLHHFGSSAKIPMENIHDHRWPFASGVLYGRLHMSMFTTTGDEKISEKLLHYRYDSNKNNGSYGTDLIGSAYLKICEERIYHPGDNYFMDTHELHRITNSLGDESITAILTGKPIRRKCNLFAKRPITSSEKKPKKYSKEALSAMLRILAEKIYPMNN